MFKVDYQAARWDTTPYINYASGLKWLGGHAGPNAITARAVAAAGNRSTLNNTQTITGYGC